MNLISYLIFFNTYYRKGNASPLYSPLANDFWLNNLQKDNLFTGLYFKLKHKLFCSQNNAFSGMLSKFQWLIIKLGQKYGGRKKAVAG